LANDQRPVILSETKNLPGVGSQEILHSAALRSE
jgi:hypothetical protein